MKTKNVLFIIIGINILFTGKEHIAAQQMITIYTPKRNPVEAWIGFEEMSDSEKVALSIKYDTTYPHATELNPPSATTSYNCHGYAWHMSEGGDPVVIGLTDPYEEDIYWTKGSYIETTSGDPNVRKVSYFADNHSATVVPSTDLCISKWGMGPLMEHPCNYGPPCYNMNYRKYYKLRNLTLTGNTDVLCPNEQRTFISDLSIQGSTYSWTRSTNLLDEVNGQNTDEYRIKAKAYGSGTAWVQL